MSDWQWRPSGPSGASQVHKASMRNRDFVRTMTAFPFCPCNPQQSSMCKDPVKNIEHQLRYQVKEQKCMLPIYSLGGRDQSPACPQGAGPGGRLFFRLAGLCSCFLWAMLFRTSQVTISPLHVLCLVIQSCLILCNPMDCSPPGFSVHEDSPGKNTEVGCHALLQGTFPTLGRSSTSQADSLPSEPPVHILQRWVCLQYQYRHSFNIYMHTGT